MSHEHSSDPHQHAHGHSHVPANVSGRTMGAAVALTLAFVVVEAVCGWLAHSLALLSDAGHNLADAAALGFSWYALSIANKPSHLGMTVGFVAEQSIREGQQVLRAVVHDIEHRFYITHTMVQVEVEGCDADDMYCTGQRSKEAVHRDDRFR